MKLYNMAGYKLYDQNTGKMVRIMGMKRPLHITKNTPDPEEITIYDYSTDKTYKTKVEKLRGYTPITPDGILTVAIAEVEKGKKTYKDVIVTATKYLNIEYKINAMPYAVCRQSIIDIFNNMQVIDITNDMLVGLAVNQDTCPSNFDFGLMFAANKIGINDFINFYRNDTLKDLYPMMRIKIYDNALRELYTEHVATCNDPRAGFLHEHGGWCDNLDLLLKQNNFQTDIDQMLGITSVNFNVSDFIHTIENNETSYEVANEDFQYWLSYTYKANIKEAVVLKYDHDINLADFNNSNYLFIRDNTDTLYMIIYLIEGEYLEDDLVRKSKEYDFSTKFKIDFYNKYNRDKI